MGMIIVNGVSYEGNDITIRNGRVIIDGKDATPVEAKEINVVVNGDINKLQADVCETLEVTGSVGSLSTISGDVSIDGDISGPVTTISGDVNCGSINGPVSSVSGKITHK